MKNKDDGDKEKNLKNKGEKKDSFKKKLITISLLCFLSFLLGAISNYYLNPKCGNFSEKTKYILNGFKNYLKDEKPIQITKTPIECNCPVCNEIQGLEQEEDPCPIKIDVSGAVKRPGVYCFEVGSVIQDAVNLANGFDIAYGYKYISRKINLAYELRDNQKIYFPFKDDLVCELQNFSPEVEKEEGITMDTEGVVESASILEPPNNDETEENTNTSCVSINNGSKEELMTLNGVGESTAQKIIDGRPFETIEDIMNISGIGNATFEKMEDDICL